MPNFNDLMTVTVPEGELDGMRVSRFTVEPNSIYTLRLAIREGRSTRPGTYTKLTDKGTLWMSDTDAEKRDHMEVLWKIDAMKAERIVINGLGLGMVLQAVLALDHVTHVDVVERDERVIKLVGPHYAGDPRVSIHQADAYEQARAWAPGTRWDVGWSDIWPDISTDDLPSMARMNRSYGRRCRWHDCWGQDTLRRIQAAEKRHYAAWY